MKLNSSKDYAKALLIAGGSVAIAGLIYSLFKKPSSQPQNQAQTIPRETIINILRKLNREMFPVFQNFATVSLQIKQQSQGRANPEEIKMMLLEQPMFTKEIDAIEEQVLESFNISKKDFEYSLENTLKDDKEVAQLQQEMQNAFNNSFKGQGPDLKTEIPAFLTPDTVIEILIRVMRTNSLKLNSKLKELQDEGEAIDFNNPKMLEIMGEMRSDSVKREILAEYGLDQYEDPATKILQYATQTYQLSNKDGFISKISQVEQKYQMIMEMMFTQGPTDENTINKIFSFNFPQAQQKEEIKPQLEKSVEKKEVQDDQKMFHLMQEIQKQIEQATLEQEEQFRLEQEGQQQNQEQSNEVPANQNSLANEIAEQMRLAQEEIYEEENQLVQNEKLQDESVPQQQENQEVEVKQEEQVLVQEEVQKQEEGQKEPEVKNEEQ